MNILVVTKHSENLKSYLGNVLIGDNIESFEDVEKLYNYTNTSALRVKIMIIDDNAINSVGVEDGFNYLHKLLFEQKYFDFRKVIFLNLTGNKNNYSRYDFLIPELENKDIKVELYSQNSYTPQFIASLCKMDVKSYDKKEAGDIAVVQKSRSTLMMEHKSIVDENLHPDTVINSGFSKPDTDLITNRFKEDNTIIKELPIETLNIEEYKPINIPLLETKIKYPKILMVSGSKNSGTSSTVLAFGHTSASNGKKTLIIDLDTISMGLSYLVEHTNKMDLLGYKINTIYLDSIKNKGNIDIIRNFSLVNSNLHCISITLKHITENPDITFIIASILSEIQNEYDRIILDIPLILADTHKPLIDKFVDGIIINSIPYINKSVNILREVQKFIINFKQFKSDKVVIFNCGISNNNEIPVVNYVQLRQYIKTILGKEVYLDPNVFNLNKGYYCSSFENIVERLGTEIEEYSERRENS